MTRRRTSASDHANRATIATAEDHYRREKARRANDPQKDAEALEAAKQEYLKLIAEGTAKGKGGRPKKKPAGAPADTDVVAEELDIEME